MKNDTSSGAIKLKFYTDQMVLGICVNCFYSFVNFDPNYGERGWAYYGANYGERSWAYYGAYVKMFCEFARLGLNYVWEKVFFQKWTQTSTLKSLTLNISHRLNGLWYRYVFINNYKYRLLIGIISDVMANYIYNGSQMTCLSSLCFWLKVRKMSLLLISHINYISWLSTALFKVYESSRSLGIWAYKILVFT